MPRITSLRAEIGTTGDIEQVDLTGDVDADIATAVDLEHHCSDDSCDIARALEDGYPFWSAQLLSSATETPLLDAVILYYMRTGLDFNTRADSDREEWLKSDTWTKHAHKCDSCGSFTFGDDYYEPSQCDNCLAEFPHSVEDD